MTHVLPAAADVDDRLNRPKSIATRTSRGLLASTPRSIGWLIGRTCGAGDPAQDIR